MSWKTLFLHLKCLVVYQRIKEEHFNTNCISQEPAFSVTVHRRTHGKFLQVKIHRSISSPPSTTSIHQCSAWGSLSMMWAISSPMPSLVQFLFACTCLVLSFYFYQSCVYHLYSSFCTHLSVWVSVHMIFRILPRPLDLWVQYLYAQCPHKMHCAVYTVPVQVST